jgi:two-component system sensor histidine kinase KdpD
VSRGKLRVFLGAAPGVGKTYAMLEEGRRLRSDGRDVVIGYAEPHERADIEALIEGFEVVPRRSGGHRGPAYEEMDLEAVLSRRPDVALVDEMAHSNVPGVTHPKRWQDVEVLLQAGIDVLTTLNIQHLESLSDVIYEITGIAQTETIPDEVVRRADQIEIVDLAQERILERMAAGMIYPAERIDAALANYFRPGNLGALRELALSWTADRVDEAVATYRSLHGIADPWETKERVVVAIPGAEGAETVVRRAGRLAMRSGASLIGVHVRSTQGLAQEPTTTLLGQAELLRQLGGSYHEVVGDDVGEALVGFAKEQNATQIVLGASRRSRFEQLMREAPVSKVIRAAESIDIHVISYDPARRHAVERDRPASPISVARRALAWLIVFVGIPLLTRSLLESREVVPLHTVLLAYQLVAVVAGAVGGVLPSVASAFAGFLLSTWYFTEPRETFTIADPDILFALFAFLAVSVTVGVLVGYSSRRSAEARRARLQAEALAATALPGSPAGDGQGNSQLVRIREVFGLEAVSLLRRSGDQWEVMAWEGRRLLDSPKEGTESIEVSDDVVLVMSDGPLSPDDRVVLRAFSAQITQEMERRALRETADAAESMAATDRLRTALLGAVSHDLRTPLATIKASLTSLIDLGVALSDTETRSLLESALEEAERLNRLVGQLLDASRVQAGAVHVLFRPVGLDEVVASAIGGLGVGRDRIRVDISESLPQVQTDPDLLERVVANLAENALAWSPGGDIVKITAGEVSGRVDLRITDRGPGIPLEARDTVFQPFQRLRDSPGEGVGLGLAVANGLLEAMGNQLLIEDTPGGGTTMVIGLKAASPVRAKTVHHTAVPHA